MKHVTVPFLVAALTACANPLNRVTADRYSDDCATAGHSGNLRAAEELCGRALTNVDWGNLGPDVRSEKLYNLGHIKRQLGKFAEAEQLLKDSLALEEQLSGASSVKVGRRLAELSVALAAQDKWPEGLLLVERLLPIADSYSGHERSFVGEIFQRYAPHASAAGNTQLASALQAKGVSLVH